MARDELVLTFAIGAGAAALLTIGYLETPFDRDFEEVGAARGIDPDLLRAIARQESQFVPTAVSQANRNGTRDFGLMQVNEATARALGRDQARLLEPRYSIDTAAELLQRIRSELGGKLSEWTLIAAYNAGSPAILSRGVFNVAYASAVSWNLSLYRLARLLKGGRG